MVAALQGAALAYWEQEGVQYLDQGINDRQEWIGI